MITTARAGTIWIAYDNERFVEDARQDGPLGIDVQLRPLAGGHERWWGPAMREARGIYEKCIDCHEGRQTCPGKRCRECDIAWLVGSRPA